MALELMPNCCIGVRTNIGLLNKDEYVDLYNELSERWKDKNCSIYHSFIVDNSYYSNCNKQCSQELSTKEKNDFMVNLAQNGIVKKKFIYPQRDCSLYTCTNNNSFVIDPLGYLYKCWADVGIHERSVGNLVNGITNYDIFPDLWLVPISLLTLIAVNVLIYLYVMVDVIFLGLDRWNVKCHIIIVQ